MDIIRIASRGSKLAIYQTEKVKEELQKHFPEKKFEVSIVKTKGDKILDVALSKIGDKDLFTKELELLLLDHNADLAVHSLKDLPTNLPEGLALSGVLERGEVRDVLISIKGKKLADLDESDIIATSSLRRKSQLLHFNKNLKIIDIRGNIDTRIQKMNQGYCTAMVMAAAGIMRLGFDNMITEIIDPSIIIPAVSQGAIAIETRENDPEIESMIRSINHKLSFNIVNAERAFLRVLEGGCQIPVGCYSEISGDKFRITGIVGDVDGSVVLKDSLEGPLSEASKTAIELAQALLNKGAGKLIEKIRNNR